MRRRKKFASGSIVVATPTATSGSDAVTPHLVVEYVDTSGVLQTTTVVNGVTSISGVAPFLVQFDASGSRASAAYAAQSAITDEEAHAFIAIGYRMTFGETTGANWSYPAGTSYTRDEETGPPLFSRVYSTAGTYTAKLRIRDELGNEGDTQVTVVVSNPATTVNIPVSAGSWPTFSSGTKYTLDAGGNYSSFGLLHTSGLHNVLFSKTGSGADPIIGEFSPEARHASSASTQFEARARHIRLVNISVGSLGESNSARGWDYVGIIGGEIRSGGSFATVAYAFFHEGGTTQGANSRYPRGFFLQDTVARNDNDDDGYIFFGYIRGLHARNTEFRSTGSGPGTWLMLRLYGTYFSFRNNLWFNTVNSGASNGTTMSMLAIEGVNETAWRSDDTVGPLSSSAQVDRYGYIGEKQIAQHNQFYAAGSYLTNGVASTGGNPDLSLGQTQRVWPRLTGWEDNVWYPSGDVALSVLEGQLGGKWMFWRGNRRNMGAGSYVTATTQAPNQYYGVNDFTTYNGPYFREDANTRPVPSTF